MSSCGFQVAFIRLGIVNDITGKRHLKLHKPGVVSRHLQTGIGVYGDPQAGCLSHDTAPAAVFLQADGRQQAGALANVGLGVRDMGHGARMQKPFWGNSVL